METPTVILVANDFLVINKPSGWVVNDAVTVGGRETVQSWLGKNYNFPIFSDYEMRNGIVHRLDKETSGVLIIAKTADAFTRLQDQFRVRTVKKTYTALVHGLLNPETGEVEVPVGRLPWNRERFGVLPGGRPSFTRYLVIEKYLHEHELLTLVELHPETGRTHQLRIHMKHLNHPIVSDTFYAGRKTAKRDRQWCPRLFLHAAHIEFSDPSSGERVQVDAPLPKDLASCLARLAPGT